MNFLIDTDWTIDYLNGAQYARDRLDGLGISDLGISVVSVAELYEGVLYSRNVEDDHAALSLFLEYEVTVLGIDMEICRIFGRERGRLRRQGRMTGDMDLLIASTCLRHNLTLLSNNRRHFESVEGLEIISA